ncbi:MAG: hypothetical protein RSD49_04805 [Hafnia sp.]
MKRIIRELALANCGELSQLYKVEEKARLSVERAIRKSQGPMNILNLLVGKKDADFETLKVKHSAAQDGIEALIDTFRVDVANLVHRYEPLLRDDMDHLEDKISFFRSEIMLNEGLKEEIKVLKNDVKAYLEFEGVKIDPEKLLDRGKKLSSIISEKFVGIELDENADVQGLREHLIVASRHVGGRTFKINHLVEVFSEQLDGLKARVDQVVNDATQELSNLATQHRRSEMTLGM